MVNAGHEAVASEPTSPVSASRKYTSSSRQSVILFLLSFLIWGFSLAGVLLSYPLCKNCGSLLGTFWTLFAVATLVMLWTGLTYASSSHDLVPFWRESVTKPVARAARARRGVRIALGVCYFLLALVAVMNLVMFAVFADLSANTPSVKDGDVRILDGLDAPVKVHRDELGALHIDAQSRRDVFFAQGFSLAQERLWQLEFNRRAGFGRLSELFGEATFEADQFLRSMGFGRESVKGIAWLDADTLSALTAYAEGVNAYVASSVYRAPIEFRLFGIEWEPWRLEHSIVVAKLLSFDLSLNVRPEAERWNLVMASPGWSEDRVRQVYGKYLFNVTGSVLKAEDEPWVDTYTSNPAIHPGDFPFAAPLGARAMYDQQDLLGRYGLSVDEYLSRVSAEYVRDAAAAKARDPRRKHAYNPVGWLGFGGTTTDAWAHSNNWVVSGKHTTTGKPLLMNDPHLWMTVPLVWTMGHLKCPEFEAQGVMVAGLPWNVIGHNGHAGWAFTNTGYDAQDLFIMEAGPADGTYVHNGTVHNYEEIVEEIIVAGRSEEFRHVVQVSLYGPVMTQYYSELEDGPDLCLRWNTISAKDGYDVSLRTFRMLNEEVRSFEDFRNAMSYWTSVAGQNVLFANDTSIGYTAGSLVPVRPRHDGAFPVPGNGTYDWSGFVPYEHMPAVFEPAEGFIITANQRPHPDNTQNPYSHMLFAPDYLPGFRARQIRTELEALLVGGGKVTAGSMKVIQNSVTDSMFLSQFRPALERMSGITGDWQARLLAWDGRMAPDSVEATVYGEWFERMLEDLIAPALDVERWAHALFVAAVLGDDLEAQSADPICVTKGYARCHDFARDALNNAIKLVEGNGTLPWGQVMYTYFDHGVLGASPLACMFQRYVGKGGSFNTPNMGQFEVALPHQQGWYINLLTPSVRLVMDLADLRGNSEWVMPMGNSGAPYDKHFDDLLDDWATGRYHPMLMDDYQVKHTLTLTPA